MRRWLGALCLLVPVAAHAIDPGTASGRYSGDTGEMRFAHAVTLQRGNEEGLLHRAQTVRVVLSDVEVPAPALEGIVFLPVTYMARAGKVRGVLLEFDPADRTSLTITVLDKPDAPPGFMASLTVITRSNAAGLWRRLEISDNRIVGEIDATSDSPEFEGRFSAPVFHSKVTADEKGAAVRTSEQVRVLISYVEAFARGDRAAVMALASTQRRAILEAQPPEFWPGMRQQAPQMLAWYKTVNRVVVRGNSATALTPKGGSIPLILEGGKWVAD
jgi:hypothetical protein